MTMVKRLIITVGRDGTVRAETKGVFGSACLDDVALLEDLLDATTVESNFTEDYHRVAADDRSATTDRTVTAEAGTPARDVGEQGR
ncbi:MAG: DUF2997 domain-containing protein [Streptosporangiales bacterium]|nr:DUF2997 domain-containing protein [Streptosporangiales bacterium]